MSAFDPSRPAEGDVPRQVPQYGEYATPEQQRAAIRQPPVDPAWPAPAPPQPAPAAAPAPANRTVDRIITIAMLTYGFITVLTTAPQLWDFSRFAETWMQLAGISGTFTNTAQGDVWGPIAAALFVVGWLVTTLLSWRRLRAGRLAFWVPLAGAAVTYLVLTACLVVPLMGDPAVVGYLTHGV